MYMYNVHTDTVYMHVYTCTLYIHVHCTQGPVQLLYIHCTCIHYRDMQHVYTVQCHVKGVCSRVNQTPNDHPLCTCS